MDVYSPSHPTDQDADCEIPDAADKKVAIAMECSHFCSQNDNGLESCLPKLHLSPLSTLPDMPADVVSTGLCTSQPEKVEPLRPKKIRNINEDSENKKKTSRSKNYYKSFDSGQRARNSTRDSCDFEESNQHTSNIKNSKDCSRKDKSLASRKESSRHSISKSSRHRSRSPRRRHRSRSRVRSDRKRSSSNSRHRSPPSSRSRSRDRRHNRSQSTLRNSYDRHRRDSHRNNRMQSRSRSRQGKIRTPEANELLKDSAACVPSATSLSLPTTKVPLELPPLECMMNNKPIDDQFDMDETSTPDISEDHVASARESNENFSFLQNRPPPPLTTGPNFINWQHPLQRQPVFGPINHSNALLQSNFQRTFRPGNYNNNYRSRRANLSALRELPPNLMLQRPTFNPAHANRFSGGPSASFMTINGIIKPMLPFSGILGQPPPPPPPPSLPMNLPYTVPPPPFLRPVGTTSSLPFQQNPHAEVPSRPVLISPPPPPPQSNILETLMSKVGLPTDGIAGLSSAPSSSGSAVSMTAIRFPAPVKEKSPMKKINKLLNSAANTLLNQLIVPVNGNSSPPPPPPPLPMPCRVADSSLSPPKSSMPPLPTVAGSAGGSEYSKDNGSAPTERRGQHHFEYNVQEMLIKRRRSEFSTSREWQERIALEVKSFIKPFYAAGKVSKEDCRTVLKKSVNKISKSKCSSINTKKIGEFVKLYLRKYYKYRKWQARQHRLLAESAAKEPPVQ